MAKREAYARATTEADGMELSPGVEIRDGDNVAQMTRDLQAIATTALRCCGKSHDLLVSYVENRVRANWPGRAYFIETEEDGKGVQIFQPYGLPREE